MSVDEFRFYEYQAEVNPTLIDQNEAYKEQLSKAPTTEKLIIGCLVGVLIGALLF